MARMVWVVFCLLGFETSLLRASDCAALKSFQADGTTITAAEAVTSGTLSIENEGPPMQGLPAFCRVTGILRPTSDSKIRFEVWLPEQGWNGRLLGTGNGGFAGSISYGQLANYLKRGFAVAGSDAGHQAEGTDATWAFGHPEKVKDFGWRAVHLMTERAKQMVAARYGKPQQKAYFDACSDGGREALMEAERFPDDYDGILAGAPAYAWSTLLASGVAAMQTLGDPQGIYLRLETEGNSESGARRVRRPRRCKGQHHWRSHQVPFRSPGAAVQGRGIAGLPDPAAGRCAPGALRRSERCAGAGHRSRILHGR